MPYSGGQATRKTGNKAGPLKAAEVEASGCVDPSVLRLRHARPSRSGEHAQFIVPLRTARRPISTAGATGLARPPRVRRAAAHHPGHGRAAVPACTLDSATRRGIRAHAAKVAHAEDERASDGPG
jgi:hypothetical protein